MQETVEFEEYNELPTPKDQGHIAGPGAAAATDCASMTPSMSEHQVTDSDTLVDGYGSDCAHCSTRVSVIGTASDLFLLNGLHMWMAYAMNRNTGRQSMC